jgi:hypothetical protein
MSGENSAAIQLPTQQQVEESLALFQAEWGLVDEVLYRLCRDVPGHHTRNAVSGKLALIGRGYAAGLERCVSPPAGQQAIGVLTDFVFAHGDEVDEIIAGLDAIREPLDATAMAKIVEQHGRLIELLRAVTTRGKAPRSFASKYLHFHRPVVPIFDDYVRQGITPLVRWDSQLAPFPLQAPGDRDYWEYCVRFLRLYDACRLAGVQATVKSLDTYLWAVPGAPGA